MLNNILCWNFENPLGFMLSDSVWGIFKDHFSFLATKNESTLCETFENRFILASLVRNFLPFELIALSCWVDCHESPCILNASAKTFELNNFELRVDRSHIFLLAIPEATWGQLEMDNWPLSNTIDSNV